ncbi:MAG: 2-oxo acid dehydrogenase subunit E2, partial [Planctomycetota bacterium]
MYILKMPQNTPQSAIIGRWLKSPGDNLAKGDALLQVETPQALIQIETSIPGSLHKIFAPEGSLAQIAMPLAMIGDANEDITDLPKTSEDKEDKSMTRTEDVSPAKPLGNVVPILMPQAGQSMEEGTILEWKVKPGDRIETGQVIMEIETDKATMDVEAVDSGRLARIVVEEGQTVDIKTPFAYLADNDSDTDAYLATQSTTPEVETTIQPTAKTEPSTKEVTASVTSDSGRVKASPAARKLAAERQISLIAIGRGSGPGGRIVSDDVLAAQPQAQPQGLSKMRKAIAKTLMYSKQNIPHFYAKTTIEADRMYELYQQTKERFKCSLNDFVVAACATAVRQWPVFRSRFEPDRIVELTAVNIGIAVGTDEGLVVPVLIDADKMNFEQLAGKSRQIIETARTGKVEAAGRGVFTVTNLG